MCLYPSPLIKNRANMLFYRAGGGGNTKDRKAKIQAKNTKLNEERVRKIHEEEKAKAEKAMEGQKQAAIDESAIHPSRRRMVPSA